MAKKIAKKQIIKKVKRSRSLIIFFALTAVILSVSTYAWFIGMRTVYVSSFDVEIAATDSLLLSIDGSTWQETVNISKANYATAYDGNTNSWGGAGLIPMSSAGAMNTSSSKLKIYEKTSLTATSGGYRIMSNLVDNSVKEQEGYVAFDLFVKNSSGSQYIQNLNPLDEEAIYLTTDSEVTVAGYNADGTPIPDGDLPQDYERGILESGIENSVRVAFSQIGRVPASTKDVPTITGISCHDTEKVTSICRTDQIWEPNDEKHVINAIKWYNASCKKRNNADLTKSTSYDGACGTVVDGVSYPTYAINSDISSADRVDVYDGTEFNTWTPNAKVQKFDYFTDSKKILTGVNRPTFMTLAPNSITKVRIYIYIEGQDVDNYDFAIVGKKIAVKFGFTKERFTEDDIDYNGPSLDGVLGN
jgi:hypothetical protein